MSKKEGGALRFLYNTAPGRVVLKVLCARWISKLCGKFLDSKLSKPLIKKFVKKNGIDLSQFHADGFSCFNDCFCRKIKEGLRPIPADPHEFFAPCDGLLSAYKISADTVLPIKQSRYTIEQLLADKTAAKSYEDGICLVFRLCVDHYHRYCYLDNASKGENVFIPGKLHTVRPIALARYPVFVQNCREYTVMDTENFGKVTQIEVGAMLVGKIKNHHGTAKVKRGDEKGMFLYGGSTIILLLEKDSVKLDQKYFDAAQQGEELPVRMGECLNKDSVSCELSLAF